MKLRVLRLIQNMIVTISGFILIYFMARMATGSFSISTVSKRYLILIIIGLIIAFSIISYLESKINNNPTEPH